MKSTYKPFSLTRQWRYSINYCGCHNNLDATHIYRCLHPLQIDFILHTIGAQSVLLHMEGCPFRDTRTQLYVEVCKLLQLYCLNVSIKYTLFFYTQFAHQRTGPQPGLLTKYQCMLLTNCAVLMQVLTRVWVGTPNRHEELSAMVR